MYQSVMQFREKDLRLTTIFYDLLVFDDLFGFLKFIDLRGRAAPEVLFKINIDIYKQTNINPSKCPKSTRTVSQ